MATALSGEYVRWTLPLIGAAVVYLYERSACSYFGVPSGLIQIDFTMVARTLTFILLKLLGVWSVMYVVVSLGGGRFARESPRWGVAVARFVVVALTTFMWLDVEDGQNSGLKQFVEYVVVGGLGSFGLAALVFRSLHHAWLALLVLAPLAFADVAGAREARDQRWYPVLRIDGVEVAVVRNYGDTGIARDFDRQTCRFGKSVRVISLKDESRELVLTEIGTIRPHDSTDETPCKKVGVDGTADGRPDVRSSGAGSPSPAAPSDH